MFSPGSVWAPGEARLASSLQSPVSPPVISMWLTSAQLSALTYWDNPRDSGIVCGSVLVCLLAVRYISLIRWVSHRLTCSPRKAAATTCFGFILFKRIFQAKIFGKQTLKQVVLRYLSTSYFY